MTNKRRRAGVSIVEVVVASSLLLIALVPILKAMTTAQVTSRLVERKTRSLMLAQGKMSDIQARAIYEFSSDYAQTGTVLDAQYLCNVSDDEDSSLKTISVSVGYDANGDNTLASEEILVTLKTMIALRS